MIRNLIKKWFNLVEPLKHGELRLNQWGALYVYSDVKIVSIACSREVVECNEEFLIPEARTELILDGVLWVADSPELVLKEGVELADLFIAPPNDEVELALPELPTLKRITRSKNNNTD